MNKKGQFYFIAIIALAVVFVGFITISNKVSIVQVPGLSIEQNNMNTELSYLFDYFSSSSSSSSVQNAILYNLSVDYANEIGLDKNLLFLYGNPSGITLSGNKIATSTAYINLGSGNSTISGSGIINQSYTFPGTSDVATLTVDGISNNFTFYPGENAYYVLSYPSEGQNFVFHD